LLPDARDPILAGAALALHPDDVRPACPPPHPPRGAEPGGGGAGPPGARRRNGDPAPADVHRLPLRPGVRTTLRQPRPVLTRELHGRARALPIHSRLSLEAAHARPTATGGTAEPLRRARTRLRGRSRFTANFLSTRLTLVPPPPAEGRSDCGTPGNG